MYLRYKRGGLVNMIYYDSLFDIQKVGDYYVLYFGNLHKAIKLNYKQLFLVKTILKSDGILDEKIVAKNNLLSTETSNLIDAFVQKKVFFHTQEELNKEKFENKYIEFYDRKDLRVAYLHLTQRCNLNCYYCYNQKNLNNKKPELSTDEWKYVVKQLDMVGIQEIVLTGGEATLRGDIKDILDGIPKNVKVTLLTNGTMINKIMSIIDYVDKIIISLDSLDDTLNELNRKLSKNFNVYSNILNIPLSKRNKIYIRSVITKNNIDQLAYIKQKLSLQKFNHITCVYLPNSKSEISEFIPYPHDDSVSNLMEIKICGACKSEIAIDSNGDVYPCQMLLKKEFLITNIKKDSWQDDLKRSKVYALFNQNVLKIDECKDCVYKFICGNGCKALCKNLYGKINRKNYFMCDYFKEEARSYIKGLFL